MKILVAYDGTLKSKEALRYGMEKAKESGGEVIALHVFDDTAFIGYDVAGAVERARSEYAVYLEEAKNIVGEAVPGVRASVFSGEGNPEEETLRFAIERNVDLLLCPQRYTSVIEKFREVSRDRGRQTGGNSIVASVEGRSMAAVSLR